MGPLPLEAFRFALDHTVDLVMLTDMQSVVQYVNPSFEELTGYAAEEVIGRKPSILASEHTTAEMYQAMWSTILEGGWWRGELINRKKSGEEWHSFLSISQIRDGDGRPVAYVGIARDITELKRLEARLRDASLEAIFMLSVAAEAKDDVTGSHIQRVQHFSKALASALGLSETEAEEIGYSSMMHDIGKMYVPDAILRKAGPLGRDEWDVMVQHPANGVVILRDKPFYVVAREIAGNHHERWDGKGYPGKKRGEEIPLSARIVKVADVFDALTSRRPYKEAWSEEAAVKELVAQRGTALDPRVVDTFVCLYQEGAVSRIRRAYRSPDEA